MVLKEFRWTLPAESIHRHHAKKSFSAFMPSTPGNPCMDWIREEERDVYLLNKMFFEIKHDKIGTVGTDL